MVVLLCLEATFGTSDKVEATFGKKENSAVLGEDPRSTEGEGNMARATGHVGPAGHMETFTASMARESSRGEWASRDFMVGSPCLEETSNSWGEAHCSTEGSSRGITWERTPDSAEEGGSTMTVGVLVTNLLLPAGGPASLSSGQRRGWEVRREEAREVVTLDRQEIR